MSTENVPRCEEDCQACSGEACRLCGAGCWDSSVKDCDHDALQRHTYPESVKGYRVSRNGRYLGFIPFASPATEYEMSLIMLEAAGDYGMYIDLDWGYPEPRTDG